MVENIDFICDLAEGGLGDDSVEVRMDAVATAQKLVQRLKSENLFDQKVPRLLP